MSRLIRGLGIFAVAVMLVACDKSGNFGGMLPDQGDYTSNKPSSGTVPCADGSADCAVVPADTPKPLTLGISFPDFPDKTEFLALPGTAFTLLVVTTAADTATLSCTPENAASLTPTGPAGSYLLFLNAMPNQDVPCTITATGAKGDAKLSLVVHPAPKNTVIPLAVRNLPAFAGAVTAGKKVSISNFYIDGFDATTSVTASCTVDPKPLLIENNVNAGWYNLEFIPSPAATGTCTITATRASDNQTASDTITLLYGEGPAITPVNFLASAKLPLVSSQGYFAVVDPDPTKPKLQFPVLHINSAVTVALTCTDDHGAKWMIANANATDKDIYTLTVGYSKVGDEGSTDTCTVTATDAKNLVSTFTITLAHTSKPLVQQIQNVPPKVNITGKPIVIQNITVMPMDANTKLGIRCTFDKKAMITPTGNTFSATIAGGYYATDNCIIVASNNGIQTAVVPFNAIPIYAQFTPKNFGADMIIFMEASADKTHYYAFSVDNDGNANNPLFTIDDPEGIVSATIYSCSGPNKADYSATQSSVVHFPGTNSYYLNIKYGKFVPDPNLGDVCTIKAVDSTGQVSYEYVYLQ